jgi:hypothetical protein
MGKVWVRYGRRLSPSFLPQFHTSILPNSGVSPSLLKNAKFPQEKRTCAGGLGLGIRFGGRCAVIEIYILSLGSYFLTTQVKRLPPPHMFHKMYLNESVRFWEASRNVSELRV